MSLDPLSLPIKTDMAFSHYYARDYDTAIELLNKVKESNPDYANTYGFLAFAYREKGMYSEAIDSMEKLLELKFQYGDVSQELHQHRKRDLAKLRNDLKKGGGPGFWRSLVENEISENSGPYYAAVAYSALGESDKAFEFLEKAFKARYTGMVWLKVTPELDNVRSDTRFQDLLRRVGN